MLVINSSMFSWNPNTKTFASEASDIEDDMTTQGYDRLERRNNEWGFFMRSDRTGRLVWFKRTIETRDRENDLLSVEFLAEELNGLRAVVFND